MSKKVRRGDIVEVEWVDSERINLGWKRTKPYRRATAERSGYRTSGYWLDGAKDRVLIVQSMGLINRHVTDAMSIPRSAVTSIRVLGRAHKKVRRILR